MNVLIIGATGAIGKCLLERLIDDHSVTSIQVIARTAVRTEHTKITCYTDPLLSKERIAKLTIKAVDCSFCCLGTTMARAGSKAQFKQVDYDMALAFNRLALANGAKQLHTVTALGANKASWSFYSQIKGQLEEAVKALGAKNTLFYRPSLLINAKRSDRRLAEGIAEWLQKPIAKFGWLQSYVGIDVQKVANAMVAKSKLETDEACLIVSSREMQGY